jgi:hypothetical protein
MNVFEIEGIRLNVVEDNDTFLAFGVDGVQHPAAAVSKAQLDGFILYKFVGIKYTYRFRLMPTAEQRTLLAKHFGCTRYLGEW